MAFTDEEIAYVRSQPLGRLATLGAEEQPDVVPVAVEFDGTYLRITPTVSWSWNLAGEPAGGEWYPSKRTVH